VQQEVARAVPSECHHFRPPFAVDVFGLLSAAMSKKRRRRKPDCQSHDHEKNCTVDARSSMINDVQGSQYNKSGSQFNDVQYNFNLTLSITISKENTTITILAFF